jgi:hypothetical protein
MDNFPNIPKLSFVLFYRSILLQLYHHSIVTFFTSIIHWVHYHILVVSLSFYVVFLICSIFLGEVRGKCFILLVFSLIFLTLQN